MRKVTQEDILNFLKSQKDELFSNGVIKLGLFGSYARGENSTFSDIDIVIESNADFIAKKFKNPLIFFSILDDFKAKILAHFGTTADICDVSSMSEDEKAKFLAKVIYA